MVSQKFQNLGWVSKIQKRRHTFFFSIAKLVAIGSLLKKKDKVYSYMAEDNGRDVIITYLDGMPREKDKKIEMIDQNTFLEIKEE